KRAYCLKTQPATGETYPKSDLFNKAFLCMQVRCLKRKHDRSQVLFLAVVDRFPFALGIVALSDYS
ncbi:hypothetical protein, partial [Klebsiella pneumoniae]|uniref:hypothetical protein n=1 Tax=Klebsiella pneumoniae TaxID=573 RepID=UPI0031B57757